MDYDTWPIVCAEVFSYSRLKLHAAQQTIYIKIVPSERQWIRHKIVLELIDGRFLFENYCAAFSVNKNDCSGSFVVLFHIISDLTAE